jgi:hypothetical protein
MRLYKCADDQPVMPRRMSLLFVGDEFTDLADHTLAWAQVFPTLAARL